MKTNNAILKLASIIVFAVFVFQANQLFGQEDLVNQNKPIVIPPIANNIIHADQTI